MHIDEANLTKLWQKYASQSEKEATSALLQVNTNWHHRCWIDWWALPDDDIGQLEERCKRQ